MGHEPIVATWISTSDVSQQKGLELSEGCRTAALLQIQKTPGGYASTDL